MHFQLNYLSIYPSFRRFCKVDRMRIPNIGERVPYVIIYGEPGKPLIQSVRSPDEVLKEKWLEAADCQNAMSMRPNAAYYITKVIVPALSRCLSLVGADVMSWYVCLKPKFICTKVRSFYEHSYAILISLKL